MDEKVVKKPDNPALQMPTQQSNIDFQTDVRATNDQLDKILPQTFEKNPLVLHEKQKFERDLQVPWDKHSNLQKAIKKSTMTLATF